VNIIFAHPQTPYPKFAQYILHLWDVYFIYFHAHIYNIAVRIYRCNDIGRRAFLCMDVCRWIYYKERYTNIRLKH